MAVHRGKDNRVNFKVIGDAWPLEAPSSPPRGHAKGATSYSLPDG